MQLHAIETGHFKLDGGAMFGVVPKTLWNKLHTADSDNLIDMSMRCLLVQSGKRLVLIDNGIGDKQDAKFFSHYHLHGEDSLSKSLRKLGFTEADITDVFLTHLHFDHCGGSVKWNESRTGFELSFPNATYWTNEDHWNWAIHPNPREKASFLRDNLLPIQESGHLKFISPGASLFEGFDFLLMKGHTESMMLPLLTTPKGKVVYCADLLPFAAHVPLPYVMGYDVRPLITMEEKAAFLENALSEDWTLFFEHDVKNECGKVIRTDKGIRISETFPLHHLTGR
ncbi:MAG: MBL fold metallo-hydrolase [Bacteroidota bacterium]